jgi:hypothetical protein
MSVTYNQDTSQYEITNRITGDVTAYSTEQLATTFDMLNLDRYIDGIANHKQWKMHHKIVRDNHK